MTSSHRPQFSFSACGIICFDSPEAKQVIVVRKRHDNDHFDKGFPKGGMKDREGVRQCAGREFEEETGIEVKHLQMVQSAELPLEEFNVKGNLSIRYFVGYCTVPNTKPACQIDGELNQVDWESISSVFDDPLLLARRKFILREALRCMKNASFQTGKEFLEWEYAKEFQVKKQPVQYVQVKPRKKEFSGMNLDDFPPLSKELAAMKIVPEVVSQTGNERGVIPSKYLE